MKRAAIKEFHIFGVSQQTFGISVWFFLPLYCHS